MLDVSGFIEGMRHTLTPVSIVTTNGTLGPHGATVSAVCSLTAEPPAVLVCLNRKSRILGLVEEHGVFCVNFLTEGQRNLGMAFAGDPRFAEGRSFQDEMWRTDTTTGAPILRNASAAFACHYVQTVPFGTHRILIGKAQNVATSEARPLGYWQGGFREIVRE